MPLQKTSSRAGIASNIREMAKTHPQNVAVAAALRVADEARKRAKGGPVNDFSAVRKDFSQATHPGGLLTSHVAGRTDHIPLKLKPGSYVVPADIVSGLGQGNTVAGAGVLGKMFPHNGTAGMGLPSGKGPVMPYKDGGKTGGVPIMAAGGEYIITPEAIKAKFGSGDHGSKIMDAWIKSQRKKHISTLKRLPGPAKAHEHS